MFTLAKAPPELLEALRAIDPAADLICVGNGWWVLGVHAPNPPALKVLHDAMADDPHGAFRRVEEREFHLTDGNLKEPTAGARLRLLQLYAYGAGEGSPGFKPIELYQTARPTFAIVEDFRDRDHNWRTDPEGSRRRFKEGAAVETGDARRMATLIEYVESEASFWFHHVMKRARRFWQRKAIPKGA